jgi:D-amino-acid dehydrogenase
MQDADVIIIGGGIIGACSAWYLAEQGKSVIIVERDTFGKGASHGNCGLFSPSHVIPLPHPGALLSSFKMMSKANSPLSIKPTLNPSRLKWFMDFALKCNESDMLYGATARRDLLDSSKELFLQFQEEQGIQCDFDNTGALFVCRTQKGLDEITEENELMDQFDRGGKLIKGEDLKSLEPALVDGLAGAIKYDCDNHFRPDLLLKELRRCLEAKGVQVIENAKVETFHNEGLTIKSIDVAGKKLQAKEYVVATGAWTPFLKKLVGKKMAIQPGKGYSITMNRPNICPTHHLAFPEVKVIVTPWKSGYRIGSTMEFTGYDESLNKKRLDALLDGSKIFLKDPHGSQVEEEWCGFRPMTPDGLPVIDYASRYDNVFVAAGHNMLGMSMGFATGKLVAEKMCDLQPHLNMDPYRFNRI